MVEVMMTPQSFAKVWCGIVLLCLCDCGSSYLLSSNLHAMVVRKQHSSRSMTLMAVSGPDNPDFIMQETLALAIDESAKSEKAADDDKKVVVKKERVKKVAPSRNPRDNTGFNFRDEDGEYDVPIIDTPMWYRLQVRRSSEKRFCDSLNDLRLKDDNWANIIDQVFYPSKAYVRFKGNALTFAAKPMTPGLVYIKTKMNPDIADDLEGIKGVYGFVKNAYKLVVPIPEDEGMILEEIREKADNLLESQTSNLKKDEYVSIVDGEFEGRYGILMGCRNGKLEVCLRSDYKDDWELFDIEELEYLAEPPEKKVSLMTGKEAVESLMAKDPFNPTIKALKQQGKLEEILYPDGRATRRRTGSDWDMSEAMGREGGRSLRSMSTDVRREKERRERSEGSVGGSGSGSGSGNGNQAGDIDMGDWGQKPPSAMDKVAEEDDEFSVDAWSKQLSAAGVKGGVQSPAKSAPAKAAGQGEDFDSFIQGLLSDMDGQDDAPKAATPASAPASASAPVPKGEGKGIVEANGRREWVPANRPVQAQEQRNPPKQWNPPDRRADSPDRRSPSSSSYDDPYVGGVGGFGEYETFPSRPAQSRPTTPRDRDDSERILDELLKDLDMGKGKGIGEGEGLDVFDFSDDDDEDNGRSAGRATYNKLSAGGGAGTGPGAGAGAGVGRTPPRSTGSAPRMEDFASFEQYLDALVNHERTSLGSGQPQARKLLGRNDRNDGDSLDDDLLDLLGDGESDTVPKRPNSNGMDNRYRDSLNPNRSWSPRSGGSGSTPLKGPEMGWDTEQPRSRQEDSYSSRSGTNSKPSSTTSSRSGSGSGSESAGGSDDYDDLDSFLNSLEDSNVLSTESKAGTAIKGAQPFTPSSPSKEERFEAAAAFSDTKKKEYESMSPSGGVEASFAGMTVKDLKDKLRERGLPLSGTKAELLNRLRGR